MLKFAAVFGISLTYAICRYLVFGPVLIANFPCYVTNKAFAISSVFSLCIAAVCAFKGRTEMQREWFAFFKITLFVHVLESLFLYSSDYYPKMFATEKKMNLYGELFMFFGMLALAMMLFKTIVRDVPQRLEFLQPLALFSIALHLFFLGFTGWPKVNEWPGHMPPITLIGFLTSLTALVFQLLTMNQKRAGMDTI